MTKFERERLVELLTAFARRAPGSTAKKLFKLLYLLDVAQVRSQGRSVTGLQYGAYAPGPVPWELDHILEALPEDFSRVLLVRPYSDENKKARQIVEARDDQAESVDSLTRWQLAQIDRLIEDFGTRDESEIDVTPFDAGAWQAALSRGRVQPINWEEVLEDGDPHRETKLQAVDDQRRQLGGQRRAAHH